MSEAGEERKTDKSLVPFNDPLNLKGFLDELSAFLLQHKVIKDSGTKPFLQKLFKAEEGTGHSLFEEYENLCRLKETTGDDDHADSREESGGKNKDHDKDFIIDFQKAFSGAGISKRLGKLADFIQQGEFDEPLRRRLTELVLDNPESAKALPSFVEHLGSEISEWYFNQDERQRLADLTEKIAGANEEAQANADRVNWLMELVRHGFATLENLPYYAADRLYNEAKTYGYYEDARYLLMREAADFNKEAAYEYASFLNRPRQRIISGRERLMKDFPDAWNHAASKTAAAGNADPYQNNITDRKEPDGKDSYSPDIEQAVEYALKAVPDYAAVWNLGYYLQHEKLSVPTIQKIKKRLMIDKKIDAMDADKRAELSNLEFIRPDAEQPLEYAYKIFFYLAGNGYPQAYRSMARILRRYDSFITGEGGYEKKISLRETYYRKAISGGCLLAMSDYCNFRMGENGFNYELLQHPEEFESLRRLAYTAKKMKIKNGSLQLGRYYLYLYSNLPDELRTEENLPRDREGNPTSSLQCAVENLEDAYCPQYEIEVLRELVTACSMSADAPVLNSGAEKNTSQYAEFGKQLNDASGAIKNVLRNKLNSRLNRQWLKKQSEGLNNEQLFRLKFDIAQTKYELYELDRSIRDLHDAIDDLTEYRNEISESCPEYRKMVDEKIGLWNKEAMQ